MGMHDSSNSCSNRSRCLSKKREERERAGPEQVSEEPLQSVRRVQLSGTAAAISVGHFLELCFGARRLAMGRASLMQQHLRYVGCGPCVACFLCEKTALNDVLVPLKELTYSVPAQQAWLKGEVEELIQVSSSCSSSTLYSSCPPPPPSLFSSSTLSRFWPPPVLFPPSGPLSLPFLRL